MLASLIVLPLLAVGTLAQSSANPLQFGPNEFPLCAQGCQNLQQAFDACQAAPTLQTCFCQSAYLTIQNHLASTGAGVCPSCTAASDQQQLSSYFNSYCAGNGASPAAASSSTAPAAAGSTKTSSPTATARPVQYSTPSWWSSHAKWIAMVIVLIIAFTLIIVGGIFWKRRHDRRVNRAMPDALPAEWGPNTNPHSYPGVEKNAIGTAITTDESPISLEKGNGKRSSVRLSKLMPGR